jgi:hypothetical protein
MISIRLSDEEYSSIKTVCDSYGARSVSDFTRTALNSFVQRRDFEPQLAVENRFAEIDSRLERLSRRIEEVLRLQPSASRHD